MAASTSMDVTVGAKRGGRREKVPVKGVEHHQFQMQDLFAGADAKCLGDEILELRCGVFLDLGCNEEAGDPNDGECRDQGRLGDSEEVVEVINGKVEGLPIQNTVVQSIELQGNRCGTGHDARIAVTLE